MLISVFDTSICDNNLGNQIIMESVNEVVSRLFPDDFVIRLPYLDSIGDEAIRYINESSYTIFGGTNALSSEMEKYRQWGITPENSRAIRNVILLGVGWWQYQGEISPYTRQILVSSLHPTLKHSVRDSYTRDKLASIGLSNVLVTGCPTLWSLNQEHCARIPTKKAEYVLLTFTNYSRDQRDCQLLTTLQRLYRKIFLWVQGPEDLEYARSLSRDIEIIPPSLKSLDRLLSSGLQIDYVGTRLHAGIRAMAFGHRTIIIAVDNRATEMAKDFNLPVLKRENLDLLEELIRKEFTTEVRLPADAIQEWQEQFVQYSSTDIFRRNSSFSAFSQITEPVSRSFGFDRGTPIDRYYIEHFLRKNSGLIHGTVLEVGDNNYTKKFGSAVLRSEVLNAVPSETATIVGNLATGASIPSEAFDAIILTQTLNVIYDTKGTLKHAYDALKPGGSLLLTVPGISQISRFDMDRWGDYWRFTNKSLEMLLREAAPDADAVIENFGNVAVAKAFLDGVPLEELTPDILNYTDDDYQVLLASCVRKPCKKIPESFKPVVLIYHRISDLQLDPQLLCVTPDNFDVHLGELTRNYRVVPLYQMIEECKGGCCLPGTVSLTFDDGYLDNLTNALPLLEKHKVHATIFITSGMVGTNEEFWWDAVERIFLTASNLPVEFSFAGRRWLLHTPEEKLVCADEICSLLRDCSPEEMEQLLRELFNWSGVAREARSTHRILNHRQLKELAASPYIEIGAHSKHHVRLSRLPVHRQRIEIMTSKQQLEMVINKPVRLFSYPFGTSADFNPDTLQSVIDAGYHAAIANIQGEVSLPVDLYAIPRRLVRNWKREVFCEWMRADDKEGLEAATINARRTTVLQTLSSQAD